MAQRLVPVYRPAGSSGSVTAAVAGRLASGVPVYLQPGVPSDGRTGGAETFVAPPLEKSPIVTAIVEWIANVGPARLRVKVDDKPQPDHDILNLLNKPNPILGRSNVQAFLYRDLMHFGNAYGRWLWADKRDARVRRPNVPPNALLPVPAEKVRPVPSADGTDLVYQVDQESYPAWQMLHVRYGNRRDNILLGESPFENVKSALDADALGHEMLYSLMLNNIQLQIFFSLQASAAEKAAGGPRERKSRTRELVQFVKKHMTAAKAGGALAVGDAVQVVEVGKTPEELQLSETHRRAETRAAAVARVSASVVGLGAGLETGTRNQIRVQRRLSFENGVEPLQRLMAEAFADALLPYFFPELEGTDSLELEFDNSRHAFMREDRLEEAERLRILVGRGKDKGIITAEEAKALLDSEKI